MCPECFATIELLVTGIVSTGGVTAATVKLFRNKKTAAKIRVSGFVLTNPESREVQSKPATNITKEKSQ
jgi:hypothetical protein